MEIRPLKPADAAAYRTIRLQGLAECPSAYVTAYEEDAALTDEQLRQRLTPSDAAQTFGTLAADKLVGIATLVRPERAKQRFRALIVGMYVVPEHRGTGLARKLVAACIERAGTLVGVEEVCLSVTVGNEAARRCYLACGFEPEYIEPRYFKLGGTYYDIEWLTLRMAGGGG